MKTDKYPHILRSRHFATTSMEEDVQEILLHMGFSPHKAKVAISLMESDRPSCYAGDEHIVIKFNGIPAIWYTYYYQGIKIVGLRYRLNELHRK